MQEFIRVATYCVTAIVDFFLLGTVLFDLMESFAVGTCVLVGNMNYLLAMHGDVDVHVWLDEFCMNHVGRQNELVFVVRSSTKRSSDAGQYSTPIDPYSFNSCC